jgi:hypothetical protein
MSSSYSLSETISFTETHARHLAAKVATDLKRMQRLYGRPYDTEIANYEAEIIQYLKKGYLSSVAYGYRRDCNWIEPSLHYTARDLWGTDANDNDPGKLRPNADIIGATFYSYLIHNAAYEALSFAEREAFQRTLPFTRDGARQPGISGYLSADRTYSSGGRALDRSSVRSW